MTNLPSILAELEKLRDEKRNLAEQHRLESREAEAEVRRLDKAIVSLSKSPSGRAQTSTNSVERSGKPTATEEQVASVVFDLWRTHGPLEEVTIRELTQQELKRQGFRCSGVNQRLRKLWPRLRDLGASGSESSGTISGRSTEPAHGHSSSEAAE